VCTSGRGWTPGEGRITTTFGFVSGWFDSHFDASIAMKNISMIWTSQMQRILRELQQRPLLQRLLVFAEQHGVELYAVGGTLRDICLGRPVHDVDVAMMGDVLGFAGGFANHLRAAYVPMDAERGEARVVYRKRDVLDFARMRGETIIEDLRRRDFTVNAMACPLRDLLTDPDLVLIDPHGGWDDLRTRTIRMVSLTSFRDDPLRVLRAFRLAATLDLTIDPRTLAAMEPARPHLIDVAAERIHRELLALFAALQSSSQIAAMARLGLLDVLFPELAAAADIPPQPGDHSAVWDHSVRTYQAVEDLMRHPDAYVQPLAADIRAYSQVDERQALVKLAALLHAVWDNVPWQGVSLEQPAAVADAEALAQLWEQIGGRLKLSRKQIDYAKTLLVHYGPACRLAILDAQGVLTVRAVHRWCKAVGESMLGVFVLAIGHALARQQGHPSEPGVTALAHLAVRVWDIYRHRILPVLTAPRLVTGHDLQEIFRLPPGPRFKELLDELEVAQVEGHIRTRPEALEWVKAQLP
jgi:poly(A) polymerase